MNFLRLIVLFINVLLVVLFISDYFIVKTEQIKPKIKANMGAIVTFTFLLYLVTIFALSIFGALVLKNVQYVLLLAFIVIPFIIGYFATYKKLGMYFLLQLCAFILSLLAVYRI